MSKGLSQLSGKEKSDAVSRRLQEKKGGLGYWAAVDSQKKGKK